MAKNMQALDEPTSVIAQAFKRLSPPEGPFDPDGTWTHIYHDTSSFYVGKLQGEVTLQHRPDGRLTIESYRNCGDSYSYYTIADLQCGDDGIRSPISWKVTSKVAKNAGGQARPNTELVKQASVKNGVLTLLEGAKEHAVKLPGAYACKWCLLDMVGRLPKLGTKEIAFTLIDEYDELCPGQTITFRGTTEAHTRSGKIEVSCYQHTGIATVPGVYYVDAAGRVLFYLAGMQLLTLAATDGVKKEPK